MLNNKKASNISSIIELVKGDITSIRVDAIVNAANNHLAGGGGVDGAIHKAAGTQLLYECQKIYKTRGECPVGQAVVTKAYNIPSKIIIHVVGPIWRGGHEQEENLLFQTYLTCLEIAQEQKCHTIAFPNISTGVFGFPKERAANIVMSTFMDFLTQRDHSFAKIYIVCFDSENYDIYYDLLHQSKSPHKIAL